MVELSGKSNERAEALGNLETALRVPLGSFSPLWMMYAGAASAGVAYWWMARWSKPQNLEALLSTPARMTTAVATSPDASPAEAPALEAVAAMEQSIVDAVEAVAEAEPEIEPEALEAEAFAAETSSPDMEPLIAEVRDRRCRSRTAWARSG